MSLTIPHTHKHAYTHKQSFMWADNITFIINGVHSVCTIMYRNYFDIFLSMKLTYDDIVLGRITYSYVSDISC